MTAAEWPSERVIVRVLVTGSRTWTDKTTIIAALMTELEKIEADGPGDQPSGARMLLVHGDCPRGADRIARDWANRRHVEQEAHPAAWDQLGKAAGFRRNAHMVNLGADACLAFIRDGSRGATHCADLAEKAGIPVRRWEA